MTHRDRDNHTARSVALVGGTVLLFWLLLRGKGWSFGAGGDVGLGGAGAEANVTSTSGRPTAPCRVWIRSDQLELDGQPADLPTVVARCRAAGRAEMNATGDSIARRIGEVVRALQAAGVDIYAPFIFNLYAEKADAVTPPRAP
jgi:hypothetical protein